MKNARHEEAKFNISTSTVEIKTGKGGTNCSAYGVRTNCWPKLLFESLAEKMTAFKGQTVKRLEFKKCD